MSFAEYQGGAGAPVRGAPRSYIGPARILAGRGQQWLVAGLCGLAFVLRAVGLDSQSLWRDEVDAIRFAGRPLAHLLETFVTPGQNGPLYSLLLRPWLALTGDSGLALRYFSLLWGVFSVALVYRLGRRLLPGHRFLPLLAALLAATSPYLVWYGQEGKMYSLVVALVLLSMERYLAALEEGGWPRWLGYVLVTSAAFYVHLIAALIVPAQALLFPIYGRERSRRWRPWLASLAALTLPYLPLLVWQVPLLLRPADTGFQFVSLPRLLYSLLVNYGLGVAWGGTFWALALLLGLMLAAALLWPGLGLRLPVGGVLAAWLFVPIVAFFAITLVRPLYTARYLIFILPAFLFLLALGLAAVARHSRLLAGLLLLALLALNGRGLWQQATTPIKADFRSATRYVAERLAAPDLILFQMPYGYYSFDYYYRHEPRRPVAPPTGAGYRLFLPLLAGTGSGQPYRWADGLYTNAGLDPADAARLMAGLTAGSRVVWLVATETSMWDERNLVQGWLDEHATLTGEAQFTRVGVYRYELAP